MINMHCFIPTHKSTHWRLVLVTTTLLALSGCNAFDRVTEIGDAPKMASIEDPTHQPGYIPVKMPMPAPSLADRQPNSLWQTGGRAFFRDQRASRVGDIVTIVVTINDQAQLSNETKRARTNSDTAGATNLFGFENQLNRVFPSGIKPSSLIDTSSALSNDGKGSIARAEQVNLRVAAVITQVLPNGNLVVQGKQQVDVNYDMRELVVNGIVRPQDISASNTVSYDQIAEARIAYGGRGTITDIQQPRYGDQLLDVLMPF